MLIYLLGLILFVFFLKHKNLKHGITFIIISAIFFRIIQWQMGWSDLSKVWFNVVIIYLLATVYFRWCIDSIYRQYLIINKLDLIIILFLIHGVFIAIVTYEKYNLFTALNGYRTYFFGGLTYILFRGYVKKKNDLRHVVHVLIVAITVISIELIWEFVFINTFKQDLELIPWLLNTSSGGNIGGLISNTRKYMFRDLYRPLGLLAHPHYTAYVIGLGALITFPFAMAKKGVHIKLFYKYGFYLSIISILLTTTRTIIIIVLFLIVLTIMKYKHNLISTNIRKLILLGFTIIFVVTSGTMKDFMLSTLSFENSLFSHFSLRNEGAFFDIDKTNPLAVIVGRGVDAGMYEQISFGIDRIMGKEFHFASINNELHFFYYLDRIGIIGGLLFVIQSILAFKICLRILKIERLPYYRYILIGLSLCPLLLLLSSIHILHSDIVMQFFSYSILGTIGSLQQVYCNEKAPIISTVKKWDNTEE